MDQDKTYSQIKRKTVLSTLSLFFQSGYSAVLGLIANLLVTIFFTTSIYGIYLTTLSIINVLNYFSDIGLAASLVQKKEITDEDTNTTFTIQQLMIITTITIGFLASGFVKQFYQLPQEGIYLYWALLVSFFISSLKTIPSILLERKIQFQKIVLVQIIENTSFYFIISICAIIQFGLMSFAVAVIARAVIGLISMYYVSFWIPRIGISRKSLKELISFGLPFQASSFLALVKDDLINLYLAKILGFSAFAYIGWAKKWAEAPIRIIMDNISKVLFPLISRLQHDSKKITSVIEKILTYQTMILAPLLMGMVFLMDTFIFVVPKYAKWAPALPLFYIFCLSSLFSSYSSPFINLFNAKGQVKISFFFMVFWTAFTWLLTPLFTVLFGYFGFPLALLCMSFSSLFVTYIARKQIDFSFFPIIFPYIFSAFCMGLILYGVHTSLIMFPIVRLVAITTTGTISYFLILKIVFKINIIQKLYLLIRSK